MQRLNVNLTITIPEDYVIISKVEFEELKGQELKGVWWTMKELENRVNRQASWIKEKILLQPRFKKILDVENRGFVFYPETQGEKWSFQAKRMSKFLDEYFSEIFTNK